MEHLETNNILVNFQHGFQKGHSCESQLINTIESLARSLDQNAEVDMAILDFSKAFGHGAPPKAIDETEILRDKWKHLELDRKMVNITDTDSHCRWGGIHSSPSNIRGTTRNGLWTTHVPYLHQRHW